MGNRAVIIAKSDMDESIATGIYIHWFSAQDVLDALAEMKTRGYRSPDTDLMYGMARLCQTLCESNRDGLNIGLCTVNPHERDSFLDVGVLAVGDGMLWNMDGTEYTEEEE